MRALLRVVLAGTVLAALAAPVSAQSFESPLFGLATAPNGDILVADAGAGVVVFDGQATLDIAFPLVTDISPIGRSSLWATRTGTDPQSNTGQALFRISQGKARLIADLFAFEQTYDPDSGPVPDSNPFDVQSLGGGAALVVDAGGNDLLKVDNQGNVEVLAVFPDQIVPTIDLQQLIGCPNPPIPPLAGLCFLPPMIPAQAVPTSVAVGPDGYYYVGELKGFPAPWGESNIWRVSPHASWADCGTSPDCELVFDGGFTSIIDLAFDSDGNLHVAELDEQSWFAVEVLGGGVGGTINSCDVHTLSCTEVATGIPIPDRDHVRQGRKLVGDRELVDPGTRNGDRSALAQASTSRMTVPCTSVRRMSRPLKR